MGLRFGVPLHVEEVKAAGDNWEVSGYASTFGNADRGGDVVQEGAFDRTLTDGHVVKFLHSHDPRLVLGVPKALKPDGKGLFGTFRISKTQLGEDTHTLLKDGALDSFSIGYIARGWEWQRDEESEWGEVRLLKDVDLLEVSLVALPMNPEALVTSVKHLDGLSLAEQARRIAEALSSFYDRSRELVATLATRGHPLTESKRTELAHLLETFSGLDAVRSDLERVLASAPAPAVSGTGRGVNTRLEIARRRLRLAGILEG